MSTVHDKSVITAERISEAGFAPYGELLENKSERRRRDFSVHFAESAEPLEQKLWVNRLPRHPGAPVRIDVMETHPHSAQTFVPMQPGRCLVVVALSDGAGKPAWSTLRAFVTEGGQGVAYRPGVWHFAFTSLDCPNEVVVLMGYTGRDDTIIEHLPHDVEVIF